MAIQYQDLNPTCSSFTLNKKEYELRAFDLAAQVWARAEFATKENNDGLVNLSILIQDMNNLQPLFKCAWHLLKRKRDFGFFDEFVHSIEKGDDDSDSNKVIGKIYKAFTTTLGVSQPQIEEIEEDLDLKKH